MPRARGWKLVIYRRMRTPGVEPGPLAGQDPKSCASASSATFATAWEYRGVGAACRRLGIGHPAEQRLEAGFVPQPIDPRVHPEKGHPMGAFLIGLLQPLERDVDLPQRRMGHREVVGGDV